MAPSTLSLQRFLTLWLVCQAIEAMTASRLLSGSRRLEDQEQRSSDSKNSSFDQIIIICCILGVCGLALVIFLLSRWIERQKKAGKGQDETSYKRVDVF